MAWGVDGGSLKIQGSVRYQGEVETSEDEGAVIPVLRKEGVTGI